MTESAILAAAFGQRAEAGGMSIERDVPPLGRAAALVGRGSQDVRRLGILLPFLALFITCRSRAPRSRRR